MNPNDFQPIIVMIIFLSCLAYLSYCVLLCRAKPATSPLRLMDTKDLASLYSLDHYLGLAKDTIDIKTLNMISTLQDELDSFI